MKKNVAWLSVYLMLFLSISPALAGDVKDRMRYYNTVEFKKYVELDEITAPTGDPATNRGWVYVKDNGGGESRLYYESDAGTVTDLVANAGGVTLDGAYDYGGAGSGKAVTVDSGAIALTNNAANNNGVLTVEKSPVGAQSGDAVTITVGAQSTGDALQFANTGSGNDIAGSGGTWSVTAAGVGTFSSIAGLTAGLTVTGGTVNLNASSNNATNINTGTSTGAVSIGGGSGTVAVNSAVWDISTTGAVSGVTTISATDDISLANGKALKSSTTTAETVKMQAYDVDNTTFRDAITLTNGNVVAVAIGSNNETVAINSADWDIGATGDMTGIGAITMDGVLTINNAAPVLYANEAITFTHATNGAADDLTFDLTGATDSSIIIQSAGTGEDTIKLNATAGGVDVDAAAAKDVNIAGGQVALVSKDNAASAISLTANIGTSETIVVTNTQGTGEGAITLTSTAGGIDMDGAAAKDINIAAGQVALVSKDNAASAISLTANIGASETIVVTNTQGTAEGAITLTSTAGGIDMDAAAAKNIDISGGQVLISSKDNAASAIALTANTGVSETIVLTNTQGNTAGAITLTATAGGITLNANSGITTGDAITGDGTAALGGFLKTVTDDTDGKVLTVAESGTVQTNAGSGGAAAWTLPSAAVGITYTFVVMAAQELRVTPAAGDKIVYDSTVMDAAEYYYADAIGESLTIVAVDGTNWIVTSKTGTWAEQTP